MRRVADLLFFSSFFIALCAAALSAATSLLLGLETGLKTLGFVFCGTLFVYNSHALYSDKVQLHIQQSERHIWVRKNRAWLLVLSVLALAGCVLFIGKFGSGFYIWLAHLVLLAVGYTVPLIPYKGRWLNLRSAPLLKVLLIAYVWAAVTVQLPLVSSGVSLPETYIVFTLYGRFIFILALAPLFDIRDIERDSAGGIITLPNLMGLPAAKGMSVLLLVVFSVLVYLQYSLFFALALMVSAVAAIFVVVSAKPGHSERFYSGLADGMMLLQAMLVAIAGFLFF